MAIVIDGSSGINFPNIGRRNLIINGGFDVWQRGTSFGVGGIYTADRYLSYMSTVDKSSDVPVGAGVFYSALCTGVNTAALIQKIEDVDIVRYSGQNLTFSLWAKGSGNIVIATYDGSTTVNHATVTLTSSWQKFSVTINRTWTTHSAFQISLTGNQTIYTTGWQVELGSIATPFEHRSYGEELALCQRYFQRLNPKGLDYARLGIYYGTGGNAGYFVSSLATSLRTVPAVTPINVSTIRLTGNGTDTATSIAYDRYSIGSCMISLYFTTGGTVTAGDAGGVDAGAGAIGDVYLDAEL